MNLTEEDAKTRRCQMSYAGTSRTAPVNCIASSCMAWRWFRGPQPDYPGMRLGDRITANGIEPTYDDRSAHPATPAIGYCGMAGIGYHDKDAVPLMRAGQ